MPSELHTQDVGTIFEPTVKDESDGIIGLATATVMMLRFRKPNGTLVVRQAVLSTDGSDGKMRYVTVANDLDIAGIWRVEGYVETPDGKWTTNQHRFRVFPNLDAASTQFVVPALSETFALEDGPPSPGLA